MAPENVLLYLGNVAFSLCYVVKLRFCHAPCQGRHLLNAVSKQPSDKSKFTTRILELM